MSYFKEQYKNLCPGVWVWEDFLSAEELVPIMEELKSQDWNGRQPVFGFKSFAKYKQRVLDSLNMPDAEMPELDSCIRRKVDEGMEPHVDIQNHANPLYYNVVDENSNVEKVKTKFARFGAIIYFNDDYEGGEIDYLEHNFSYKPKAGSIVFHYATNVHAVAMVKSGHRFTHSTYLQDSFWVDKNVYENIDWPFKDGPFTVNDSRYWYSYSHGPSTNPALAKIQKTFVDSDHRYGRSGV